jgi:RecB family endonuclease NucS
MGKIEEIRSAIKACFEANQTPLTKSQAVAWIGTHYPDSGFNMNTLTTQLYRSCANVNHTQKTSAPQILWYEKSNRTYRLRRDTDHLRESSEFEGQPKSEEQEFRADASFAVESHLRDYLARNLGILEPGLRLWKDDPPSIEFPLEGRRIDILARDPLGAPVIIELKVSRGHERTVGQALYYRGKLRSQLGVPKVRIILVAGEITDELRIASSELSDLTLYEYSISMSVSKII